MFYDLGLKDFLTEDISTFFFFLPLQTSTAPFCWASPLLPVTVATCGNHYILNF
jgi:hypothetical protein